MKPDYEKVSELLVGQQVLATPAQLHGLMTGQVCTGAASCTTNTLAGLLDLEGEMPAVIEQLLERFFSDTKADLANLEFDFYPILPSDDEELGLRLHALGRWCDGFTLGFGTSWNKGDVSLLEETREVLADFAQIAEVETDPDADTDQSEEDYMELVEYLRIATLTLFQQNTAEDSLGTSVDADYGISEAHMMSEEEKGNLH